MAADFFAWWPGRGQAVLSDGAILPRDAPDFGTAIAHEAAKMVDQQEREIVRTCPICKVAMVRRVKDEQRTVYECLLCKTVTVIETRQPVHKPPRR